MNGDGILAASESGSVAVPAALSAILGPTMLVRRLPTKTKSTVLLLRSQNRLLIAKTTGRPRLERELLVYGTLLPRYGLAAPKVVAWLDDPGEAWLVLDFLRGRAPDLQLPKEQAMVSRWLARLHVASRSSPFDIPPPLPFRPPPEERLTMLENAITGRVTDASRRESMLASCATLRLLLPLVRAGAALLRDAFVHGDVAEQNLVLSLGGVVGLDWDCSGLASPAADLASADPSVYAQELAHLGEPYAAPDVARARLAGRVLADLSHDLAARPVRSQQRYLDRMLRAAEALAGDDVPSWAREKNVDSAEAARTKTDAAAVAQRLVGQPLREMGVVRSVESLVPNPYTSRMASMLVELTTSDAGPVSVLLKGGDAAERTRTGQAWGVAREVAVYESVLTEVPAYRSPFLGRFWSEGRMWLVLRWLDGALLVNKATPQPDVMVATARWLGTFHRQAVDLAASPAAQQLTRYSTEPLSDWVALARTVVERARPAWRPLLDEASSLIPTIGALLSCSPTLVHGDFYPSNVLYVDGMVVPIDWEWAGVGAGELDLAALTDGWPAATTEACLAAYASARGSVGADPEARLRLAAAEVFLAVRWLGGHRIAADDDVSGLHGHLRRGLAVLAQPPVGLSGTGTSRP